MANTRHYAPFAETLAREYYGGKDDPYNKSIVKLAQYLHGVYDTFDSGDMFLSDEQKETLRHGLLEMAQLQLTMPTIRKGATRVPLRRSPQSTLRPAFRRAM